MKRPKPCGAANCFGCLLSAAALSLRAACGRLFASGLQGEKFARLSPRSAGSFHSVRAMLPTAIFPPTAHGSRHVDERSRAHPSGCLRQSILLRAVPQ